MPTDVLPEGALLLHLGPSKTGTTAIQLAMHEARAELARHGVYYPGPFRPAPAYRPAEATRAALGSNAPLGRREPRIELWEQLVADLAEPAQPRAVLSSETLARADDAGAARVLSDLGPDRVHLVYTARRLDRLLPSHWQQRVKGGMTWSYFEYVRRLTAPFDAEEWGRAEWQRMWSAHDVSAVVGRWSVGLPPHRVTVIVADESDHDLLARTFAGLLGIDARLLRAPDDANRSLGLEQVEALRRVNQLFVTHGWGEEDYFQLIKRGLTEALIDRGRDTGSRRRLPGLPADALEIVHDRADAQADAVHALRETGVHVVGDPDTLRTRGGVEPARPDETDTVDRVDLDLFGAGLAGTLDAAFARTERRAKRAGSGR